MIHLELELCIMLERDYMSTWVREMGYFKEDSDE
jgi:hypothetical protein